MKNFKLFDGTTDGVVIKCEVVSTEFVLIMVVDVLLVVSEVGFEVLWVLSVVNGVVLVLSVTCVVIAVLLVVLVICLFDVVSVVSVILVDK